MSRYQDINRRTLFLSEKKYILSSGVFDFSIEDDDTINNIALAGDGDPVGVVGT